MAQKKRAKVKRPEQAPQKQPMDQNTKMMIALGAVVVVLIVVVGFMWSQRQSNVAANQVNQVATNTAATTGGSAADIKVVEFDPATATKVTDGKTPEEFLEAYLTYVDKKEYSEAFKMLPLDRQNYYKDAMAFGTQLDGYGIDGHTTTVKGESKDDEGNDQIVIHGSMKTPNGNFGNDWTFVNVDDTWYVKTRGEVTFDE